MFKIKKLSSKIISLKQFLFLLSLPIFLLSTAAAQTGLSTEKLIDTATFYKKIKLQHNFYLHINGNWMLSNPLPASRSYWGNTSILNETNLERLNKLYEKMTVHAPLGSKERLLGNLYLSSMDTVLIEAKGYEPIKDKLLHLDSLEDKNTILNEIAKLQTEEGISNCLFHFRVKEDDKNPQSNIAAFYQGGLNLPSRSYYSGIDSRSREIQYEYLKFIKDMFQLVGYSKQEAARKGNAVFEIEKAISDNFVSGSEREDPEKAYHKYTISNFSASTQIDWQAVLSIFHVNLKQVDYVLVYGPDYFNSIHYLIDFFPLKKWVSYLQWTLIYNMSPYLNNAIAQRKFIFSKILSGQQERSQRWRWATNLVDNMLDGISGKLFVESYFTDSAIKRVGLMVDNLQNAFAERIKQLPWMTDVTKHAALEKLSAISNKIGFPEKWPDYNGLATEPNDFAGNIKRIKKWDYESMISKLGKPVSKDEWFISAATVNAFYYPLQNEIFLPAGILQPPFFNMESDDAVNYGAIGSIIGHELTHGFDNRGSKYDKDGRLFEWWNKQDAQQFSEKVDDLIYLYNELTIGSQVYINGAMTINENIADLGGLAIAYDAFKKTQQGKGNILIDGLTADQRFFISYAQTWRSNVAAETAYQDALIEPHAPSMFRCNVPLSNLDAFYEAFIIQKKDDQFRPPGKRVKIW